MPQFYVIGGSLNSDTCQYWGPWDSDKEATKFRKKIEHVTNGDNSVVYYVDTAFPASALKGGTLKKRTSHLSSLDQ